MTWQAFTLKWMILLHRWMGIAFCLIFILFFVSGIVMMYARMPSLTNEERLRRLPDLDFSAANLQPVTAWQRLGVGEAPTSVRLAMLDDRPVYRLEIKQKWQTVFADNGEVLPQITADHAIKIASTFFPEDAQQLQFMGTLAEPDQWTLSSTIRRLAPLHKIALNDDQSTQAYLSAQTGEVVLKTDAASRFWGYAGAVVHWIYFTPLRKHTGVWVWAILIISFLGSLMCLFGMVIGIWRLSIRKRYQRRSGGSMSPYRGLKRLHHWLGLIFGWFTFTWMMSGMFSMNPFDWSPGTAPTPAQVQAVRGDFDLSKIQLPAVDIQKTFEKDFKLKELELVTFRGDSFYRGVGPPREPVKTDEATTTLAKDQASETELRTRLINAATGVSHQRFSREEIEEAAISAMPTAKAIESVWLNEYDAYYYSQDKQKNLPVLRVKFDDANATWLYLDPQLGKIVLKHETLSRVERWIYQGLHSLDFPVFYQSRPYWDIVLIFLSFGGIALSWTAVKLSWVRVKKKRF